MNFNKNKKILIGTILVNTILFSSFSYASEDVGLSENKNPAKDIEYLNEEVISQEKNSLESEEKNEASLKESLNIDSKDSPDNLYNGDSLNDYNKNKDYEDILNSNEEINSPLNNTENDEDFNNKDKFYDEVHQSYENEKLETSSLETSENNYIYKENLERWNDSFAGNRYYDPNDEKMYKLNEKMDDNVSNILELVDNSNDNYWIDINNYDESKHITKSYRRFESLAKQYTNKGSKFYNDPNIKKIILNGLEWEYNNNYNENSTINGNWWDYEIGTPRAINNTLSLLHEEVDQDLVKKYTAPINHFVPNPYKFRVTTGNPFEAKGGNLIDMGRVKIISGFLQNDKSIVNSTIESLKQIYEIKDYNKGSKVEGENNGFYIDGSYVDHDNIAYNGAYGNVMLDGFSQLLPAISKNTDFDKSQMDTIHKIIDEAFLPLMHKTQMMDMVRGRSISREKLQGHDAGAEVIRAIMRIAEVSNQDVKDKYNSIIKYITENNNYYNFSDNLNNFRDIFLYNKIQESKLEPPKLQDNIHIFNNMDKVVYKNNDHNYTLGFSLHSDKIKNFEYMNGENSKGWYTSDGAVYLYNNDLSHYSDNYWATLDYRFIPSTTEIVENRDSDTSKKYDPSETLLKSDFVGATKLDENNASIAMDFNNWNDEISLKKSWFILGDKIIFLGSDINNPNNNDVYTTIENRKLNNNSNYTIYIDDKKFSDNSPYKNVSKVFIKNNDNSNENIGYYFLKGNNLEIAKEKRKGRWKDVNRSGSNDIKTNSFLKIVQKHNDNKGYAYVLIPSVNKKTFDKMSNQKIDILANNEDVQAVRDNNIWAVSLFKDMDFKIDENITINNRGIYTIKKVGDRYIISYYDPTENYTLNKEIVKSDYQLIKKPEYIGDNFTFESISKSTNNNIVSKNDYTFNKNKDASEDNLKNLDKFKNNNKKDEINLEKDITNPNNTANKKIEHDIKVRDDSNIKSDAEVNDNINENKEKIQRNQYEDNKNKIMANKSTNKFSNNPKTGVISIGKSVYILIISLISYIFSKKNK